MNRREFLHKAAVYGVTSTMLPALVFNTDCSAAAFQDILEGIQIVDAHAHPDMASGWTDNSASYRYMLRSGIMTSSFSALGDENFLRGISGSEAQNTKRRLEAWLNGLIKERKITLVRSSEDVPKENEGEYAPGAILSIEGGDALEGDLDKLDDYYKLGVRIITLIHYRNNEIGDVMRASPGRDPGPFRGKLSEFGYNVVGKMEQLGILIDVAHANTATLVDILSVTTKPVIDSHTSPYWGEFDSSAGRMRTWKEIELIVKNGGVICTWPMARSDRRTVKDWAKEIYLMKQRIGIEYIGLGTDCGGSLPRLVEGYHDERDFSNLANAMMETGLSKEDISAFMGGNVLRVLKTCIG